MSFEKGNKVGLRFGEGQPKNKGGRKKKIYSILKKTGYSREEILDVFQELIWSNEAGLNKLLANKKQPIIIEIVTAEIKSDELLFIMKLAYK